MTSTTIIFLVTSFQTVIYAVSCHLENPLILNKDGDDIFFPRYMENTNNGVGITYVEPGDENTSTYTFCNDDSSAPNYLFLFGILLEQSADRTCSSQIKFNREVITENGQAIPCGDFADVAYQKYRTYFNLAINQIHYQHTSYEYCFSEETNENTLYSQKILYAHYDLENPSLLENQLLSEEQSYDFDLKTPRKSDPTTYVDWKYYMTYYKEPNYTRQEVAVSQFIPFAQWRKTFYQWHNVAPMRNDLIQYWSTFVTNVRSKLARKREHIKVYSGVYNNPTEDHPNRYLKNGETEVPMYWWIILYNKARTHGVSLIMHNYKLIDPLCVESICANVGLQGAVPKGKGYKQAVIYCCPASAIPTKIDNFQNDLQLEFNE